MEFVDSSAVEQIEMKMICPSQFAIRDKLQRTGQELETLINSIRGHGLLQLILITPFANGFEIVAGHRRFQACQSLRGRFLSAKIRELTDKQAYGIQITENIQRKSISTIKQNSWKILTERQAMIGVPETLGNISFEVRLDHLEKAKLSLDQPIIIGNNFSQVQQAVENCTIPLTAERIMST